MELIKEAAKFLKRHGVNKDNFKLKFYDGFFLAPNSVQTQANRGRVEHIIYEESYFEILLEEYRTEIEALSYFLKLNKIKWNPRDTSNFHKYMAILCYVIALYKRRINFEAVVTIGRKEENVQPEGIFQWDDVKKYLSMKIVKKMYAQIYLYLTDKKGLSPKTAKAIMFSGDEGINNILDLLNVLESMYHPAQEDSLIYKKGRYLVKENVTARFLKSSLQSTIEQWPLNNSPFIAECGEFFEKWFLKHIDYAKVFLLARMNASSCIVVQLDADTAIKKIFKKKTTKLPDFVYLDDNQNIMALDSKFSLTFANPDQVKAKNLIDALNKLNFTEEVKKHL